MATPRLKQHYDDHVRPKLQEELGFTNPHQIPRLVKVVLNVGDGDLPKDQKLLDSIVDELGLAYLHLVDPVRPSVFDNPDVPRMTPELRPLFRGPLIVNGGFDREAARETLAKGDADLVAFGVPFIANPDLPERLRLNAPLTSADRRTFYGGDARGYTDYPPLATSSELEAPAAPA